MKVLRVLPRLMQSVRVRLKNVQLSRQVASVHREAFSRNPEKHQQISKILESYHLADGLKHPFQAYKLLELDRLLHVHKPQNILELGTGSSSKIFMAYLQQSPSALLTCVDENQLWLDEIAKVSMSINLSDRVNLWCAPREIRETDTVEFRYRTLPEIKPDLIFVDGPSHLLAGHNLKNVVDSNALDFTDSDSQPIIVVSARRATVDYFSQMLETYKLLESDLLANRFHRDYRYFSIFEPVLVRR